MSISLKSILRRFTASDVEPRRRPYPTHEAMMFEHERRKAEELRRRLANRLLY